MQKLECSQILKNDMKSFTKIILGVQILYKIQHFSQNENLCQKSKCLSKIKFFVKNQIFFSKIELFVKSQNFCQKSIFLLEIKFFVKNQNFHIILQIIAQ